MKGITAMKVVLLAFLLSRSAMSQTERTWWVYMTPQEGIELYNSPHFKDIRAVADQFLSGYNPAINKISHTESWISELDQGLEHTAAVYFALKHGKYNGSTNPEMQPYIDFSAKWWLFLTQKGKLSTWVKNQQYSSPDWYEGDITLRYWILGAFPSYDAIRYDLPTSTRTQVDTWLSGFASVLWDDEEQLYENRYANRGTASFGQALLIRLILQDKAGVDAYWDVMAYGGGKKNRGYKNIVDIFGYPRNSKCTSVPDAFGYSDELRRRDGVHGIIVMAHAFNTMFNFTHAARNGGSSNWDILSPTNQNQAKLRELLDLWYRFAFGDLYDAFNTYARCVESDNGLTPFWDPLKYGLKQKAGYSLAFIDERFETADWAKGDPATNNLWKLRSRMLRNTEGGGLPTNTRYSPAFFAQNIRTYEQNAQYFSISGKRINTNSVSQVGVYLISDKNTGTVVKRSIVNVKQ